LGFCATRKKQKNISEFLFLGKARWAG